MAIINMTVGHAGTEGLKFKNYALQAAVETPIARSGYPDFFVFTRNGVMYLINHSTLSANRVIYKYDPSSGTFTQETTMTLPPVGTSTESSNAMMCARHYLYDPNTDTVHYAADYLTSGSTTYRAEYKFNFLTNTWTQLEVNPLSADQSGYNWTINSAGAIAMAKYSSAVGIAPYRLVGTTWTILPASPCQYPYGFTYNADDELCMIDEKTTPTSVKGVYIFNETVWTQLYSSSSGLSNRRVCSVDNEGNIAMLGRFSDPSRPSSLGSDYQVVYVYTKEQRSRLNDLSYGGMGSITDADLQFSRAAITWIDNVGGLVTEGSNYLLLTIVKPLYELVEN